MHNAVDTGNITPYNPTYSSRYRVFCGEFSVAWIVITSGSVYFNSESTIGVVLILDATLTAYQLLLARRIICRSPKALIHLALMIICVVLSILANADFTSILTYARLILVLTLAFGASQLIDNRKIAEVFAKTAIVIASISVLFFYTGIVENNPTLFPTIDFHDHQYTNAFI